MTAGGGAAAILQACEEEIIRRESLPMIATGQIADSYDTLHGVRFIELILGTLPSELADDDRLHHSLYLFDAFIIENLRELSDRAAKALGQGRVKAASDALCWVECLLKLMHDAGGLFPSAGGEPGGPREAFAVHAFQQSFEGLCRCLRDHFTALGVSLANDPSDLEAKLLHQSKTITLQVRETVLNAPRTYPDSVNAQVAETHLRCVAAAASGISLHGDTYINQFCLLHQLPELLTPLVLRSFEAMESQRDDPGAAVRSARVAGDLLFLITASLWPLIELLEPSAYYAFRENLGATSGSSSAAIRGKLLTSAYVRWARSFVDQGRGPVDSRHAELTRHVARIRGLIYRWRGLHMALPRNVLGAHGTKSLMGSPDALKAVETMADSFAKRDPLTALFGPLARWDFAQDSAAADLDAWLLATTGEAARQRFRQVQERTGPWRKT